MYLFHVKASEPFVHLFFENALQLPGPDDGRHPYKARRLFLGRAAGYGG